MTGNAAEVFRRLKKQSVSYPKRPFPFGKSPCHYWPDRIRPLFHDIVAALPPHSDYLELGSLLGAGSTKTAMQANPTLRAVCMDRWNFQPGSKYPMLASHDKQGRPVAFLRGRGDSMQHFMNNTWQWRLRIAPFRVTITPDRLRRLHKSGYRPQLILIDDDHRRGPVRNRLETIHRLWPEAAVVLDDYAEYWPEVKMGVEDAYLAGWYRREDAIVLADRLLLLKRSSAYAAHRDERKAEEGQ